MARFSCAPDHFARNLPDAIAYLLALRAIRREILCAGGSNAKVLRWTRAAKATTVFESSELAAKRSLWMPRKSVVGTSPDGKV